ncbi:zinc transporter ZntB [Salipiger sp. P9]|uniref:zinc transporter ZntB n=1 Tax=Salipiger pentaromativorans TaxID=2943193 RepID=UPI00215893C4|nr:zinc transporter ZntB [Salipiger pentaromativorans]MCR8551091.1 zinc transporter ZntB [Salipiger pentaromativorans]
MYELALRPDDVIQTGFALNGAGRGRALMPAEAPELLRGEDLGWVHLRAHHPDTPGWIVENLSYLDPTIIDALVAEETRPRVTRVGEGLIVILRGINTVEGEDPEDMVSVRLWIDPRRIVSLSRRRVRAIEDIAAELASGHGPRDCAGFLVTLVERLTFRIESFWSGIDDEADALEEAVLDGAGGEIRTQLVELRRRAIILRRYLQPQRDALRGLQAAHPGWLEADDLRHLAEELDALERVVEDADAMRERMALVRDELAGQLSERLNRNMYMISILSALFLPLGFLTGLFGINVAGLPGAGVPGAFWIFLGGLGIVVALQLAILRRLHWI